MKLSIIIPAYNEEKRIGRTLEDYGSFFSKRYKKDFEIIAVLNGCRDNTLGVVKNYGERYPQLKYRDFKKGGKGFAITEGFKVARGDLIGFTDADDSTSAAEFNKLIGRINGYSGIIGSRWIRGAIVSPKQPISRRIASRGFNWLVKLFFGMKYYDTQCGAKLFKKNVVKKVLPKLGVTEWAFDIDLLYQMKLKGLKTAEVPIRWQDSEGGSLKVPRTTVKMFLAIVRLRIINSRFKKVIKIYDGMPEWIKLHHKLK